MPMDMGQKMQWPTQGYGADPAKGIPGNPRVMPGSRTQQRLTDEQLREKLMREQVLMELTQMGIPMPGRDVLSLPMEQFIQWAERRRMEKEIEDMRKQRVAWGSNAPRPQAPPIGGGRGAL